MIFFGTRSRTIEGELIHGAPCPNCGQTEFQTFGVQSYFHVYWIPVIPTTRNVGLVCVNCKNARLDDELEAGLRETLKKSILKPLHAVSMFAGTFIIALVVAGLSYSSGRAKDREISYLETPLPADVYVIDFDEVFEGGDPEYPYGIIQVVRVEGAVVTCRMADVIYTGISGPNEDIDQDKVWDEGYYNDRSVTFQIGELVDLRTSGVISKVARASLD